MLELATLIATRTVYLSFSLYFYILHLPPTCCWVSSSLCETGNSDHSDNFFLFFFFYWSQCENSFTKWGSQPLLKLCEIERECSLVSYFQWDTYEKWPLTLCPLYAIYSEGLCEITYFPTESSLLCCVAFLWLTFKVWCAHGILMCIFLLLLTRCFSFFFFFHFE